MKLSRSEQLLGREWPLSVGGGSPGNGVDELDDDSGALPETCSGCKIRVSGFGRGIVTGSMMSVSEWDLPSEFY